MPTSSIIEQIQKLRSLSKSSNEHEAAAAAKAADKLINKHRISEEEISAADPTKKTEAKKDDNILYETGKITLWKNMLALNLAKHYDCAVVNDVIGNPESGRKISRYRLVGTESDMEIVRYMFSWLVDMIEQLGKIVARGMGRVYSASYAEGVVRGIEVQLEESRKEQVVEAQAAGQTAALVKLDQRMELAQKKLFELYPKLTRSKLAFKRRVDYTALKHGIRDGKQIQLSKGLNAGANTKLLK